MDLRSARLPVAALGQTVAGRIGDRSVAVMTGGFQNAIAFGPRAVTQRQDRFFAKRRVFVLGHFDQLRLDVVGSRHGDGHLDSTKAGGD